MSTELRLHGKITDEIEYFATAAGNRNAHQHFFEMSDTGLRFFAPGNELVLLPDRLRQTGTGGTFCAYMFGVDQPFSDLTKPGILNRLILLGATYNDSGQLEIKGSNKTEQTYEEIFQFGNALDNYFFFVDGLSGKKHRELQEEILKRLGKTLKRMPYINRMDDSQLATALLAHLPEQSSIYLVRLSHMKHRRFQNEFQSLYYRDRTLCGEALTAVKKLATSLNLDPQQQERIQIDVMYNHRDNYRVVDDYKKVLIECLDQQSIDRQQHARLTRLRTLALRIARRSCSRCSMRSCRRKSTSGMTNRSTPPLPGGFYRISSTARGSASATSSNCCTPSSRPAATMIKVLSSSSSNRGSCSTSRSAKGRLCRCSRTSPT